MKISSCLTLLFLLLFGHSAVAQSEAQQEMIELFRSVEKRLKQIDDLLSDASAGATSSLEGVGAAGIDEILKRSREQSAGVIQEIDRILELSQSQSSSSSSSSSGGEPSEQPGQGQQGSPLDRGPQSTSREATPEMPSGQPSGQQPGDQQGEQPGEKPEDKPGGDQKPGEKPGPDPKDPGETPDPNPENLQLGEGTPTPPGAPSTANGVERWGSLPQHAQDVFRSEGGTELPAEYRDWIDAYHRRLNREGGRR